MTKYEKTKFPLHIVNNAKNYFLCTSLSTGVVFFMLDIHGKILRASVAVKMAITKRSKISFK